MVAEGIERAGGAEEYLSGVTQGLVNVGCDVSVFYRRPISLENSVLDGMGGRSQLIENFDREKFFESLSRINPGVVNFQGIIDRELLGQVLQKVPTTIFLHNHETYCPGNSKYFFNSGKVCTIPTSSVCGLYAYLEKCMTRHPLKIGGRVLDRRQSIGCLRRLRKVVCNSNYLKGNLVVNGLRQETIVVNHLFPRLVTDDFPVLDKAKSRRKLSFVVY